MHNQVKATLARVLGVRPETIADDASTSTMPAWDSLKQLRVIMALEERFQTKFDGDEMDDLTSVAAITTALERRR